MGNGLGFAIGEGVEAGAGALQSTLNYKLALAQQQMRAGLEAEQLRMQQERGALESEQINFALTQAKDEAKRAEKERAEAETERAEAEELRQLTFPKPSGKDITGAVSKGKTIDIDTVGTEMRRKRLLAKQFPETLKAKAQAVGKTANERWLDKLLDPSVSQEEKGLIREFMSKGIPDRVWAGQGADDRLEISEQYSNAKLFGGVDFKNQYPDVETWFNEAILGKAPVDVGGAGGEPEFNTAKDVEDWVRNHPEDKGLLNTAWYLKRKKK